MFCVYTIETIEEIFRKKTTQRAVDVFLNDKL